MHVLVIPKEHIAPHGVTPENSGLLQGVGGIPKIAADLGWRTASGW